MFSKNVQGNATYLISPVLKMSEAHLNISPILNEFIFARSTRGKRVVYTHTTHIYHSMPETIEHRNIRCKNLTEEGENIIDVVSDDAPSVRYFCTFVRETLN